MEKASGDDIADVVLKQFHALPKKAKPIDRGGGTKEWVPLSGIVAQGKDKLTCLAAATGMKCLPQNKIPYAQGIVLHDWHAEILAIRSFNRFLLEECHALVSSGNASSDYIRLRDPQERTESHYQPFALNDGINLYMYCSEAPCGDASMELTMASQEDPTPWEPPSMTPASTHTTESLIAPTSFEPQLLGRSYFSNLGIVRRKPSRPDAPPTCSKSCSDKLAMKQCTSLLSSLTSLLVSPHNMYLKSIVLPSSQYSSTACTRAFSSSGRLKALQGKSWENGYRFSPFEIKTTEREFEYSRRQSISVGEKIIPSNISACYTHDPRNGTMPSSLETLIGGILQGRKVNDIRGASKVCRKKAWKLALNIVTLVAVPGVQQVLSSSTYGEVKGSKVLTSRRGVKEDVRASALRGWVCNVGDERFGVDGA